MNEMFKAFAHSIVFKSNKTVNKYYCIMLLSHVMSIIYKNPREITQSQYKCKKLLTNYAYWLPDKP